MSEPPAQITLALKARLAPETARKSASAASTGPLPEGVDAAVFAELKLATRTYDYLCRFGEPIEFWEAVRLARSHRGVTEDSGEGAEGAEAPGAGLAEELQAIRRQLSPMVRDLRRFLVKVPNLPPAGEALEVALGFLLASSREHQAVAKWLAESDKHLAKAASKLRSQMEIAAPYLELLRPWTLNAPGEAPKQASARPAAAAAPPPPPPVPVAPLDPEALDNFKRAFWCRQLFVETDLQAAFWEVLLLNTVERIPCKTKIALIAQARIDKQLAVFHEEARALHQRVLPFRAKPGRWVQVLADWLRSLPGMPQDASLFDIALGFFVVENGAQDRARRWLGDPEAHAKEAVAHVARLCAQVKATLASLKKPAG